MRRLPPNSTAIAFFAILCLVLSTAAVPHQSGYVATSVVGGKLMKAEQGYRAVFTYVGLPDHSGAYPPDAIDLISGSLTITYAGRILYREPLSRVFTRDQVSTFVLLRTSVWRSGKFSHLLFANLTQSAKPDIVLSFLYSAPHGYIAEVGRLLRYDSKSRQYKTGIDIPTGPIGTFQIAHVQGSYGSQVIDEDIDGVPAVLVYDRGTFSEQTDRFPLFLRADAKATLQEYRRSRQEHDDVDSTKRTLNRFVADESRLGKEDEALAFVRHEYPATDPYEEARSEISVALTDLDRTGFSFGLTRLTWLPQLYRMGHLYLESSEPLFMPLGYVENAYHTADVFGAKTPTGLRLGIYGDKAQLLFLQGDVSGAVSKCNVIESQISVNPSPYGAAAAAAARQCGAIELSFGHLSSAEHFMKQAVMLDRAFLERNSAELFNDLFAIGSLDEAEGNFLQAKATYSDAYSQEARGDALRPQFFEHGLTVIGFDLDRGGYDLAQDDLADVLGHLTALDREQREHGIWSGLQVREVHRFAALGEARVSIWPLREGLQGTVSSHTEDMNKYSLALSIIDDEKLHGIAVPPRSETALLNEIAEGFLLHRQPSSASDSLSAALKLASDAGIDKNDPLVGYIEENAANLSLQEGDRKAAAAWYQLADSNLSAQYTASLSLLSERERLNFRQRSKELLGDEISLLVTEVGHDSSAGGKMMDLVLANKAYVESSSFVFHNMVARSEDPLVKQIAEKLGTERALVSALRVNTREDESSAITAASARADDLERQLSQRLGAKYIFRAPTWQDIASKLSGEQVAVEVIRFRVNNDGQRSSAYTYGALVLTAQRGPPTYVSLGDAGSLDPMMYQAAAAFASQTKTLSDNTGAHELYRRFWGAISPYLSEGATVYVAPDGVLSEIPIGALPDSNGKLAMDIYDVRNLTTTRDLLRRSGNFATKHAAIFAAPDFGAKVPPNEQGRADHMSGLRGLVAPGGVLRDGADIPDLPHALAEARAAKKALDLGGWSVSLYPGADATKPTFESASARVIHVATHGFLLRSPRPGDVLSDPMDRSGLLFAGAQKLWTDGVVQPGTDDGVLTASEVAGLDLSGTELVVLSACQTGLGSVEDGEGIIGLRRGFQEAGASDVILSLWSVDDDATSRLFEKFYLNWIGKGESKSTALRNAIHELRDELSKKSPQGDVPFYWAAFILIGSD